MGLKKPTQYKHFFGPTPLNAWRLMDMPQFKQCGAIGIRFALISGKIKAHFVTVSVFRWKWFVFGAWHRCFREEVEPAATQFAASWLVTARPPEAFVQHMRRFREVTTATHRRRQRQPLNHHVTHCLRAVHQ
jgi:hypothetical protein